MLVGPTHLVKEEIVNAFIDSIKLLARLAAAFFWSTVVAVVIVLWMAIWVLYWRKK